MSFMDSVKTFFGLNKPTKANIIIPTQISTPVQLQKNAVEQRRKDLQKIEREINKHKTNSQLKYEQNENIRLSLLEAANQTACYNDTASYSSRSSSSSDDSSSSSSSSSSD